MTCKRYNYDGSHAEFFSTQAIHGWRLSRLYHNISFCLVKLPVSYKYNVIYIFYCVINVYSSYTIVMFVEYLFIKYCLVIPVQRPWQGPIMLPYHLLKLYMQYLHATVALNIGYISFELWPAKRSRRRRSWSAAQLIAAQPKLVRLIGIGSWSDQSAPLCPGT